MTPCQIASWKTPDPNPNQTTFPRSIPNHLRCPKNSDNSCQDSMSRSSSGANSSSFWPLDSTKAYISSRSNPWLLKDLWKILVIVEKGSWFWLTWVLDRVLVDPDNGIGTKSCSIRNQAWKVIVPQKNDGFSCCQIAMIYSRYVFCHHPRSCCTSEEQLKRGEPFCCCVNPWVHVWLRRKKWWFFMVFHVFMMFHESLDSRFLHDSIPLQLSYSKLPFAHPLVETIGTAWHTRYTQKH